MYNILHEMQQNMNEAKDDNNCCNLHNTGYNKMQLDVGVSPPANIMAFRPGLTHLTFDLDPRDL